MSLVIAYFVVVFLWSGHSGVRIISTGVRRFLRGRGLFLRGSGGGCRGTVYVLRSTASFTEVWGRGSYGRLRSRVSARLPLPPRGGIMPLRSGFRQ